MGLVSLALLATACGAADESAETTVPETATTTAAPTTTTTVPPGGDVQPAPVDDIPQVPKRNTEDLLPGLPSAFAATALARRLGVEVSKLTVNVVESVTWSDGSIGCPQPGMSYTQALVPGLRVILEFEGELYYYHGTAPDDLFYCADPSEPVAGDPGDA
jgi:hypothetical protein